MNTQTSNKDCVRCVLTIAYIIVLAFVGVIFTLNVIIINSILFAIIKYFSQSNAQEVSN